MPTTTAGILMSITPKNRVQLQDYPLEEIDEMRDIILSTKGNQSASSRPLARLLPQRKRGIPRYLF